MCIDTGALLSSRRTSSANETPEAFPGSSIIPGGSSARAHHMHIVWQPCFLFSPCASRACAATQRAQPPALPPRLTTSVCWHPQHSLLMMFFVTFRTDLLGGYMHPDRKSVRDKKAEDRFSALLAESPKSSVLYDITPDGIYTHDTSTVINALVARARVAFPFQICLLTCETHASKPQLHLLSRGNCIRLRETRIIHVPGGGVRSIPFIRP
jgi:hypothetical protein